MKKFGGSNHKHLWVGSEIDLDGEICFELDLGDTYTYLSVDKVKELIKHLEEVVATQEGI